MSRKEDVALAFANGYFLGATAGSNREVTHNAENNVTRLWLYRSVIATMDRRTPRTLTLDACGHANTKMTVTGLKMAFEQVMPVGYTLKRERGVFIVRDPEGQTIVEFLESGAVTTAHPCRPVRSDDREYAAV